MNMNYKEIKNDRIIKEIWPFLDKSAQYYLVGGFLRDYFLGKSTPDRDIVVLGKSAIETAKELADKINGHFVLLDEKYDIARVVFENKIDYVDFAICDGNTIENDLKRRDFTINSIALDLQNYDLIDINNGIADLNSKMIREIYLKNLEDDPLRILRAFRFSSGLGFTISETTLNFILNNKEIIQNVAKERIHVELIKLFEGKNAAQALTEMKNNGLIFELLPESKCLCDVPPNLHHHLWLIDHSIESVNQIDKLVQTLPDWAQEHLYEDFSTGIKRISLLKIGAFLHDIGKPSTWEIEPSTGRHRFIKHDEVGAELAKPLLKKLKFSNKQIKYITKIIKNHIYPSHIIREESSEKAEMRLFRRLENDTIDVILIAMADRLGARGVEITDEIINKNINGLRTLLNKYNESKEKLKPLPKLLDGLEIMQLLDITASPRLGEIIKALKESQLNGDVITREDAVKFVKNMGI